MRSSDDSPAETDDDFLAGLFASEESEPQDAENSDIQEDSFPLTEEELQELQILSEEETVTADESHTEVTSNFSEDQIEEAHAELEEVQEADEEFDENALFPSEEELSFPQETEECVIEADDPESQWLAEIERLETQVHERDQVVAALTDRLEHAAEQLDRLQRSGTHRNSPSVSGGGAGFSEEQRSILYNLQNAVEEWTDFQPASTLSRMEIQLTELRDLIVTELIEGGGAPQRREHCQTSSPHNESQDLEGEIGSAWEAMKSRLMENGTNAVEPPAELVVDEPSVEDVAEPELVTINDPLWNAEDVLPEPVDFQTAGVAHLQEAITIRDECLTDLLHQLRRVGTQRYKAPDWDQLADAEAEQRTALEDLQARLNETLRLAEVEVSMERARLGREANRLAQWQTKLQKKMEQLGISSDAEDWESEESNDSKNGNRWKRFLGINAQSDGKR